MKFREGIFLAGSNSLFEIHELLKRATLELKLRLGFLTVEVDARLNEAST